MENLDVNAGIKLSVLGTNKLFLFIINTCMLKICHILLKYCLSLKSCNAKHTLTKQMWTINVIKSTYAEVAIKTDSFIVYL